MTATLTITLSPEILKALRQSKSITVGVDSGRRFGPASRAASSGKSANCSPGPYREGSLPAKLLSWAKDKKTFGVPEVMKTFKIKRGHASMLVAYVRKGGAVKRVGRGEYAPS